MKSKNKIIIYDLLDYRPSKKGWTYILLSKDKRIMKVGQTKSSLENRIKSINSGKGVFDNYFEFSMAINDAGYERKLHSYFSEYRVRYYLVFGNKKSELLTYKELIKEIRKYEKESGIRIHHKNIQKTRMEIFKVPPIKVSIKIKSIILEYLENEASEIH